MAAIDYPNSLLPSPIISAYTVAEGNRMLITDLDSGYRVKRKRFTKVPATFGLALLLNQAQASYFQAWFAETLDYGLNWFNMNLAVGDSLTSSHEVRVLSDPQYSLNGTLWNVIFTVEAVEMNLGIDYSATMESLFISLGGLESSSNSFDAFDYALNTIYPL